MTSLSDIVSLIATLYPNVVQRFAHRQLCPISSLNPRKKTADFRNLVQAFVTLFSFYPGCDAAAATAQVCQAGDTSLYICLSPSTPPGFKLQVDLWLTQFMVLRQESQSNRSIEQSGAFSPLDERFVLDTYNLCYPAMRQRNIKALEVWNILAELDSFTPEQEQTEEEIQFRYDHKDRLQQLSNSIQTFMKIISGETVPEGSDMLMFHKLCLEICGTMKSLDIWAFFDQYVYPGAVFTSFERMCLPIELSILLDISRRPSLVCDGKWSPHILDPSIGARQFSAVVTETDLMERFGKVPHMDWKTAVQLFDEFALMLEDDFGGYQWCPNKRVLSTRGPVNVHPEITLIHHLLENGDKTAEAYLACSRIPCYASVRYAGAVNKTLEARFTMRLDRPAWCDLHRAEPWVLPEVADSKPVAQVRAYLLRDLENLVYRRLRE